MEITQKNYTSKNKKINDPYIPFNKLELELKNLKTFIDQNNSLAVKKVLEKLLKSYKSNSKIVDRIYLEKVLFDKRKF